MLIPASRRGRRGAQQGAAMIEILVSILITAFGLLALAGLQTRMNAATLESYQRAQALTLLHDYAGRMEANGAQSANYVTASPVGTDDEEPADCSALTVRAERDRCEWSNALKGAAEVQGGANTGAMIGARGCVEQLSAANPASGVCQPAAYRISVVWQGFNATVVPPVGCAAGEYGADDSLRKAVSARIVVPLPSCS